MSIDEIENVMGFDYLSELDDDREEVFGWERLVAVKRGLAGAH